MYFKKTATLAVAVFVTDPSAAWPTFTPKLTVELSPSESWPGVVQVTTCPFASHVQPEPATLPALSVRPVGRVSVIVIPNAAPEEVEYPFLSSSEYRASVLPTKNEPECVLLSDRLGGCTWA
jgi:hypothetical protein